MLYLSFNKAQRPCDCPTMPNIGAEGLRAAKNKKKVSCTKFHNKKSTSS